ncbi:hypothetical protein SGRIM128S_02649 [Streptomyces griseomycini]
MSPGRSPISSLPVPSQETDNISDQKPMEFSPPPEVSYTSGRPRSWPYSWAKTPSPPFSGWMV